MLTLEIRERAGRARFRNINARAVTVGCRERPQLFNRGEAVLSLARGGLSVSEPQSVIEVVGKEAEQSPVHFDGLAPLERGFSGAAFHDEVVFAAQPG